LTIVRLIHTVHSLCLLVINKSFLKDIVKSLFADKAFNARHRLGAVNSINWARILAQTVYYFLSYFHLYSQFPEEESLDDIELQYVVPTGNFGDVLAGYYAKKMGLPIGKLVVATNENDILARFWKNGRYEKVDSSPSPSPSDGQASLTKAPNGVKETLSPAMDILVSSNFERLLWYLVFENSEGGEGTNQRHETACDTVEGWMSKMKSDGRVEVPVNVLELARKDFFAERISDEQVSCQSTFFLSFSDGILTENLIRLCTLSKHILMM
jgi:threonine synthase